MKKFKKWFTRALAASAFLCALVTACAGAPPAAPAVPADELDAAIRETSTYLNQRLPTGNKLIILNIQSDFPALSEYIIDELIANTVNDRVFTVVDRQQLNTIRAELDFQMSGEVDDTTAQSLGRMAGAQIIISGAVSQVGELYRLRVRALNVESAQIEGQFNRNIPEGDTIAALVRSKATGYGDGNTANSTPPAVVAETVEPAVVAVAAEEAEPAAPVNAAEPAAPAPAPEPAAPEKVYKIGDTGPAGGLVFYDKRDNSDGWRYLEVSSKDAGTADWGAIDRKLSGTDTKTGSGKRNTDVIMYYIRNSGESGKAAQLAREYSQNGYTDWFLPSKDELNLIYTNLRLNLLGDFSMERYWTSSEIDNDDACNQQFSDGRQFDADSFYGNPRKNNKYVVRPIRQF